MDAKEVLAGLKKPKRQSRKSQKHGRQYRWADSTEAKSIEHSTTKYRLRHGIGPGSRKNRKLQSA